MTKLYFLTLMMMEGKEAGLDYVHEDHHQYPTSLKREIEINSITLINLGYGNYLETWTMILTIQFSALYLYRHPTLINIISKSLFSVIEN